MRSKDTIYQLQVDTQISDGALIDMAVLVAGLEKAVTGLQKSLITTFESADKETVRFNQSLDRSMKILQRNLQDMRTALGQAAEPVGRVLLPVLDQSVRKITEVAQSVGIVLSTLMGMDSATKKVKETTRAEEGLKKASVSAATAAKRSLASFDRINRLDAPGGRAYGTAGANPTKVPQAGENYPVSAQVQELVNKIMRLLEPVQKIDFTPLKNSLQALGSAISGLGSIISKSLQWAWFEVLVPLGTWVIEEAGPATVGILTAAFQTLSAALAPVLQGIGNVRTYMEPMILFIRETALLTLEALQLQFQKVAQCFEEKGQQIQTAFTAVGQALGALWGKMQPTLTQMRAGWTDVIDMLGSSISNLSAMTVSVLSGLITVIGGTITGNWSMVWNGLKTVLQGVVNGIIGMINGLIQGVVGGINAVARAVNSIKFTLPDWDVLGNLAGKSFGVHLQTVTAPQIPYLAKGAVLPANKPFLAVVGDQKHGTNVEAPLATIQEAVALVMEDMIASNMAGQERIVSVLRQLQETVLDIRVGDEVIGKAAQRYNRKMAVVKGGYV